MKHDPEKTSHDYGGYAPPLHVDAVVEAGVPVASSCGRQAEQVVDGDVEILRASTV